MPSYRLLDEKEDEEYAIEEEKTSSTCSIFCETVSSSSFWRLTVLTALPILAVLPAVHSLSRTSDTYWDGAWNLWGAALAIFIVAPLRRSRASEIAFCSAAYSSISLRFSMTSLNRAMVAMKLRPPC